MEVKQGTSQLELTMSRSNSWTHDDGGGTTLGSHGTARLIMNLLACVHSQIIIRNTPGHLDQQTYVVHTGLSSEMFFFSFFHKILEDCGSKFPPCGRLVTSETRAGVLGLNASRPNVFFFT